MVVGNFSTLDYFNSLDNNFYFYIRISNMFGWLIILIAVLALFLCIVLGCHSSKERTWYPSTKDSLNYFIKPKQTYDDLLRTEEWKEKRNHILMRDGCQCQWCGSTTNLNVHHKYYLQYPNHRKVKPWNYPDDALITLCRDCHKKAHQKKVKVYYTKY